MFDVLKIDSSPWMKSARGLVSRLGPEALLALEQSPCPFWAMETAATFEHFLAPMPLTRADENTARLIRETKAP